MNATTVLHILDLLATDCVQVQLPAPPAAPLVYPSDGFVAGFILGRAVPCIAADVQVSTREVPGTLVAAHMQVTDDLRFVCQVLVPVFTTSE